MGTAWTYAKDMALATWRFAPRRPEWTVSGLKKLYLTGPHASAILHQATTRDVTKISGQERLRVHAE